MDRNDWAAVWDVAQMVALAIAALAVIAVPVGFLVGYADRPQVEPTIAPDGKAALLVTCSSHVDCLRKAAETCPGGYDAASADWTAGGYKTSPTGAMVIRCRP